MAASLSSLDCVLHHCNVQTVVLSQCCPPRSGEKVRTLVSRTCPTGTSWCRLSACRGISSACGTAQSTRYTARILYVTSCPSQSAYQPTHADLPDTDAGSCRCGKLSAGVWSLASVAWVQQGKKIVGSCVEKMCPVTPPRCN